MYSFHYLFPKRLHCIYIYRLFSAYKYHTQSYLSTKKENTVICVFL